MLAEGRNDEGAGEEGKENDSEGQTKTKRPNASSATKAHLVALSLLVPAPFYPRGLKHIDKSYFYKPFRAPPLPLPQLFSLAMLPVRVSDSRAWETLRP